MRLERLIICAAALTSCTMHAHGQWSLNGNKAFYNAGNVGIGTNNPAFTLEVRTVGPRAIFGYNSLFFGVNYGIYGQTDSPDGRAVYALANADSGTNFAVVGKTNSPMGYAGWFAGGKNFFEGRVGIGGTNPSQKLQVNGNIKVTGWIGTDVNQPVNFFSRNRRVLRLQDASNLFGEISPNIIGGVAGNAVTAGVNGATISGGGEAMLGLNFVTDNYSTIGGGINNLAGDDAGDTATAEFATVGGGRSNFAGGAYSIIPGGRENEASGDYSFAAGRRAVATHNGSFVWGDSSDVDVTSIAANSFTVRASGGFEFFTNAGLTTGATMSAGSGSWNNLSDRNMKENVQTVDPRRILENVLSMPITTWNYTTQDDSIRHIGPMAQDFHQAFNLGEDDRHITTIDADGVALAAIQGLHQVIRERDAQINSQQQRIEALRMEKDSQIAAQQDQIEQLRNRLARLEATLNESTALKGNARQ